MVPRSREDITDLSMRAPPAHAQRRRRLVAGVVSGGAHLAVFAALIFARVETPKQVAPRVEAVVAYVEFQKPPVQPKPTPKPTPKPPAPAKPRPPPPPSMVRRLHAPPTIESLIATTEPVKHAASAVESGDGLTDSQLAGAANAESGPPGGVCNMAGRVQAALRKDPLVRSAVAASAGKATLVWNGDWVRHGAEDGKGLAAVREAILWEVGFAPEACRTQAMRGLVVVSLNGAAGPTRLAIGTGAWRWSDLLGRR